MPFRTKALTVMALVTLLVTGCGVSNAHGGNTPANTTNTSTSGTSANSTNTATGESSSQVDYIVVTRTKDGSNGTPETSSITIKSPSTINQVENALQRAKTQNTTVHCQSMVAGLSYTVTFHYTGSATQKLTNVGGSCIPLVDVKTHQKYIGSTAVLQLLDKLLSRA